MFITKVRSAPGSWFRADYACADCGATFEQLTTRDANGDPPSSWPCPGCGGAAAVQFGAPRPSNPLWQVTAINPTNASAGPTSGDPRALDLSPLSDGRMNLKEWNKWQADLRRERKFQRGVREGKIARRVSVHR